MAVACLGGIVTAEITSICQNFGDQVVVFALCGSALEFELDVDVDGAGEHDGAGRACELQERILQASFALVNGSVDVSYR